MKILSTKSYRPFLKKVEHTKLGLNQKEFKALIGLIGMKKIKDYEDLLQEIDQVIFLGKSAIAYADYSDEKPAVFATRWRKIKKEVQKKLN